MKTYPKHPAPQQKILDASWSASQRAIEAYGATNQNGACYSFLNHDTITSLLNQDECTGIRLYFGIDDEGAQRIVYVGADAQLNDLLLGSVVTGQANDSNWGLEQSITKQEAANWTERFRRSKHGEAAYFGVFFDRNFISNILNQDNCKGVNFYYGLNTDNVQVAFPIGVAFNGAQIQNTEPDPTGIPCPPCCSLEPWWWLLGFSLNGNTPESKSNVMPVFV